MCPKNPGPLKEKPEAKMNNERSGCPFKLPLTRFNADSSSSKIKSLKRLNKQCNTQGLTNFLNRYYCIQSMDNETDCIVANLNQ